MVIQVENYCFQHSSNFIYVYVIDDETPKELNKMIIIEIDLYIL